MGGGGGEEEEAVRGGELVVDLKGWYSRGTYAVGGILWAGGPGNWYISVQT